MSLYSNKLKSPRSSSGSDQKHKKVKTSNYSGPSMTWKQNETWPSSQHSAWSSAERIEWLWPNDWLESLPHFPSTFRVSNEISSFAAKHLSSPSHLITFQSSFSDLETRLLCFSWSLILLCLVEPGDAKGKTSKIKILFLKSRLLHNWTQIRTLGVNDIEPETDGGVNVTHWWQLLHNVHIKLLYLFGLFLSCCDSWGTPADDIRF